MRILKAARLALRLSYPWMVVQWCAVHYIWAYGILRDYNAIKSLIPLVGIQSFISDFGISPPVVAIFMAVAATLALGSLAYESSLTFKWMKALMLPQYCLVFAAFLADSWILIHGVDSPNTGQAVNPVILHVLLLPLITAAIFHTLSILEKFGMGKAHVAQSPSIIVHEGEHYEAYRVT